MKKEEIKEKLLETGLFIDNEWLAKYCDLIEINKLNNYNKLNYQSHHILPRNLFKILKIKIDNSKNNRVNLLYKDHILAHYYLSKCIIDKYYHNMFSAVLFLIRDHQNFKPFDINSLDDYQKCYEHYRENYFQDEEIRKKKSLKLTGLKRSKETRNLISETSKNNHRHLSEESKNKISKGMKGNNNRLGSHHSKESKELISIKNRGKKKTKTSLALKGKPKSEQHKKNMSIARKGRHYYNNGVIEVCMYECPIGFHEGRLFHKRKRS